MNTNSPDQLGQGSLFVDGGMLPNPELYDAKQSETNLLQIGGLDIGIVLSGIEPLSTEEHTKTGEFIRSTFDKLTADPNAVLLSAIEDTLWIANRQEYLNGVATTIGMASLGVSPQERARKIHSGVGQTRGDRRQKFVNLKKSAESIELSAGIARDLVGQDEDCGFDRMTVLHHVATANGGLEQLFTEVSRVEHSAVKQGVAGKNMARLIRTQALTVLTRQDQNQPERLKVWYNRLLLNSGRKAKFWDQQVQIANGVTFDKSELIRPINTAGPDRHVDKPGYPQKKRP